MHLKTSINQIPENEFTLFLGKICRLLLRWKVFHFSSVHKIGNEVVNIGCIFCSADMLNFVTFM